MKRDLDVTGSGAWRRRTRAAPVVAAMLAGIVTSACVHQAQVWPSRLANGSQVTAKFEVPRAITLDNDSTLVVKELNGTIRSISGDTIIIALTSVPEAPTHTLWRGRSATIPLDSTTKVTHAEFDQYAVALMAVGAISFVYGFIGSLP